MAAEAYAAESPQARLTAALGGPARFLFFDVINARYLKGIITSHVSIVSWAERSRGHPMLPAASGGGGAGDGLAAEPACPNCGKLVALVAWVVSPAAASIKKLSRQIDRVD